MTGPAPCPGAGGVTGAALAGALQFFAAAQCLLNEPWPKHDDIPDKAEFEFVVVGGGTAGSVVAARLADLNYQVLLIEAGPDPPRDSIVPGFHGTLAGSEYDWNLTSVNEGPDGSSQALRGGSQALPRGKMLGGTGSLNDMVYARGFPADYEEWASLVGNEWDWKNVLPFFKKSENLTDERIIHESHLLNLHGRDGPIEVSGLMASTFDTDQFLNAFHEIGFKLVKDMTYPHEIGAGRHSHTIRNGRRDSTVTAFLNKSTKKINLSVLKNALVTQIKFNTNMRAVGVEVVIGQDKFEFRVSKEVIVSAGTYHTPKLLMLSGIGPEEHLREMGINVIKNLTGVGKNLQDHVMVMSFIAADVGTCYTDEATGNMNVIKYFYDRSGPLSYINTMAAYMAVGNSTNIPDFAFYPTCIPKGTQGFYESCMKLLRLSESACTKLNNILKEKELITLATVLMKPKSRGRVELKSSNPVHEPLIYPRTFSNEDDLKEYPKALNVVKLIVESSYFKEKNAKIIDLPIQQCEVLEHEDKVRCRAKAMAMSAWHCVGTAAIGPVVNATLVVKGFNNLRVVDASVMPTVIRGNTNAPVVMIAEKAVEFIKNTWKERRQNEQTNIRNR